MSVRGRSNSTLGTTKVGTFLASVFFSYFWKFIVHHRVHVQTRSRRGQKKASLWSAMELEVVAGNNVKFTSLEGCLSDLVTYGEKYRNKMQHLINQVVPRVHAFMVSPEAEDNIIAMDLW